MGDTPAFLLTGDLGRAVYNEYVTLVNTQFKGNIELKYQSLQRYDLAQDADGTIIGCGSFSMCLIDKLLQKYNLRTVELYDSKAISQIINFSGDSFKQMHFNLGLILSAKMFDFSIEDDYHKGTKRLKQDLKAQLSEKGISLKKPIYLPFSSLEIEEDQGSPLGLHFKVADTDSICGSDDLCGDYLRKTLENAVVLINKVSKQGLYYLMINTYVTVCEINDIDDLIKPHLTVDAVRFDRRSFGFGRILVVPKDNRADTKQSTENALELKLL